MSTERAAVETYADLFMDELNVKQVRLLDASHGGRLAYGQAAAQAIGAEIWQQVPCHPEGHPGAECGGSRA